MPLNAPSLPLTTGTLPSFSSIELEFDGNTYRIASLGYDHGLEPGIVEGNGPEIDGVTQGNYRVKSVSLEVTEGEWLRMRSNLGDGYGEKFVTVNATINEPSSGFMSHTMIEGCRIKGVSASFAKGNEGLMRKLDCMAVRIYENGLLPFTPRSNLS